MSRGLGDVYKRQEDIFIEKEATFDDLVEVAKEQNKKNIPIALGWGKM